MVFLTSAKPNSYFVSSLAYSKKKRVLRFFLSSMHTPDYLVNHYKYSAQLWCTHRGQEEPKPVYTLFCCRLVSCFVLYVAVFVREYRSGLVHQKAHTRRRTRNMYKSKKPPPYGRGLTTFFPIFRKFSLLWMEIPYCNISTHWTLNFYLRVLILIIDLAGSPTTTSIWGIY